MSDNRLIRWLFLRCLGVIYFIAFASFGAQVMGLIGSNGILPASGFLQAVQERFGSRGYWLVPTVFWLDASDTALQMVPWIGAILSLLLIAWGVFPFLGRPEGFPRRVLFKFGESVILLLLYLVYLSLVSAGQDFMAFQWDILLLEAGFLAIFIHTSSNVIIWLFRWLLFRLMFLSGAVKLLSGDPSWWNLTALDYHFETQPLPTVIGWYAHQLPEGFHRLSTLVMFFIELAIPFLFFAPRRFRLFAAAATLLLQILIFLTGNYTFFNLLAMALCLFLFDDASLRRVLPQHLAGKMTDSLATPTASSASRWAVNILAVVIIFISGFQLLGIFLGIVPQPVRVIMSWVTPFRVVNTYGLFAVMTTTRPEIIVEGSSDGQTWLEYEFKYKPGDVRRPPGWVAPHQPRLDWQMWFAALGDYTQNPWFVNFMIRLQQGSPEVLALVGKNPFPDAPPRYLRARLYQYYFTDLAILNVEGAWWRRERLGPYFPLPAISPGQP
jgi:hypothetical protein